ncbi:hypothetical protein JOB18_001808 [Solea senegalensis]|uniref:Uncharacterized protein n=1 Tax=Solea senegalensis TaxID=28829 RepID=A0AAV6PQD9_SOLSE|nr:hypothetical protein JOB18_001808 [Solea senegalensis]
MEKTDRVMRGEAKETPSVCVMTFQGKPQLEADRRLKNSQIRSCQAYQRDEASG